MRPKRAIADYPCQRSSCDVFDNSFLPKQVETCIAVEAIQISILVQVFDRASHVVNFAHQLVMSWAGPSNSLKQQ